MQISSPITLISTSNVHVQNAQTIAGTVPIEIRSISAGSSADPSFADSCSSDESDMGSGSVVSSGALTDASSLDDSPISPEVDTRRLSFFKPTVVEIKRSSQSTIDMLDFDITPKLPQRAPSHSKSAHESVHRQRSIQRMLHPAPEIEIARSSFDMIGERPKTAHRSRSSKTSPTSIVESPQENPFDQELAALHEIAQDFKQTVRTVEEEADVMHMEKYGLASFSATDYMCEIQGLIHSMFADEQPFFKRVGGFF